jgi:hypothetical protein
MRYPPHRWVREEPFRHGFWLSDSIAEAFAAIDGGKPQAAQSRRPFGKIDACPFTCPFARLGTVLVYSANWLRRALTPKMPSNAEPIRGCGNAIL